MDPATAVAASRARVDVDQGTEAVSHGVSAGGRQGASQAHVVDSCNREVRRDHLLGNDEIVDVIT